MLNVFRPRGCLYPGDIIVDSGVYSRIGAAAESSKTGDPDYIIHTIMIRVKDREWSSTVTLAGIFSGFSRAYLAIDENP